MTINSGLYSSYYQEYETPKNLVKEIERYIGVKFTLDSCACDERVAKAKTFFTPKDNAFLQKWVGNVWMNPPYGKQLPAWLEKAYQESEKSYNNLVVCLIPARTDTVWFHELACKGHVIFLKGRVAFLKGGVVEKSPPFPSMLVIYEKSTQPIMSTWDWKNGT